MDERLELINICENRKINDNEYEYRIYAKKICKSKYSNLGSKICITDINSVFGLSYIKKIKIDSIDGNMYNINKQIDDCYVIKNKDINHINCEDTIIIIAYKNISNYFIQFPEARLLTSVK